MKCRHAIESELDLACDILAEGFYNEPLHEIIFPDDEKRLNKLKLFFSIYLDLASKRGGTLLSENNTGAMVYFRPGSMEMTENERSAFDRVLRNVCGSDYAAAKRLNNELENYHPKARQHYYISLLAVRRSSRGSDVVKNLFSALNDILDDSGYPCYAECTRFSTRTLIRRWGYLDAAPPLRIEGFPEIYPVWREPH
ncbi:hypothetical protein [Pantoea sp. BAV 3049]|uniref:hypothetical protein n=1 Tax=Pantoea sp. BAV 3049 TaxID=2654188 RepID=UPI00131DD07A|nr:hypothetical protein [Pantoea sp. BAV 3049]